MFGKSLSAKEQSREWISRLKREMRGLDRDIRQIEREELKIKQELKKAAKKGDRASSRILAKSLVRSRNTVGRLVAQKAQLGSATRQISEQLGMLKVAGAMQSSAVLLGSMNRLVSVPRVAEVARAMSREMQRAGIIGEMMEETMEELDDEDMEELADAEVDKVIAEVTEGKFEGVADLVRKTREKQVQHEEEEDKEDEDIASRIANIKA